LVDVRAVVTDLDGTVVGENGTVSEAMVAAAAELAAAGIAVIVATGRTLAGVAALPTLTPHIAVAVCFGGAVGWSPGVQGLLWREAMAAADVRRIIRFALDRLDGAGIAAHDGHRWRMTDAYLRQRPRRRPDPVDVVAADEIADHPACTLAICHPHLDSADLVRELASTGLDPPPFVTYSERNLVDIGPADVDKSTGVARALSRLGVDPAEAIAFGDMPNDLPMFALCGYSVAMGNAHPDVRAAGAAVTACVHDDGVVRALRSLKVVRAARPARVAPCRCPSDLG
jgi:Cof subfamily protein (haloacid dehalogenase superfamily)